MTWVVTGGAGYIGAHVVRSLQRADMPVAVIDDLSTGLARRVPEHVPFLLGHLNDQESVEQFLRDTNATGVIHLAAKKAVGESVERPDYYYRENVDGMLSLVAAMRAAGVTRLVYSSSAAVYGEPADGIAREDAVLAPINPYGQTKVIGEWICENEGLAAGLSWVALRYFNVAGTATTELADTSVGNLIPIALRALADGKALQVFGDDYPTEDGTCLRDYVHVADLAEAHVAAARKTAEPGCAHAVNIGTGKANSVLDVVASLNRALGREVDYQIADRRAGDPAVLMASVERARDALDWSATHSLDDMTASAVRAAGLTSD